MKNKIHSLCFGFTLVILGFTAVLMSCSSPGKEPSSVTPPIQTQPSAQIEQNTQALNAAGHDVGTIATRVGNSADKIEVAASQGSAKTPETSKSLLAPFWNAILSGVGELRGEQQSLKDLQQRLVTAEENSKTFALNAQNWEKKYRTDMDAWKKKFDDEHAARLKAESSTTKALQEKYTWLSVACFVAFIVCIALGISGFGGTNVSGWAIGGAAATAIGLVVCIALVQTVALIPWIVGGIALLGAGLIVWRFIAQNKTIKTTTNTVAKLTKTSDELVHTLEAGKLYMTVAGRKAIFGDGPAVGLAHVIQGDETRQFVRQSRTKINKAPSLRVKVAVDHNEQDDVLAQM